MQGAKLTAVRRLVSAAAAAAGILSAERASLGADGDFPASAPFNVVTNTGTLPDNAAITSARAPMGWGPGVPGGGGGPASPSPAGGFQGLGDNNTLTPPDTDGCVGPTNVVTMLNTQVRIQDRLGRTNSTVTLSNWWATKISGVVFPFDPRILYDPLSKRWIATAAANPPPLGNSAILIAISQTSDPTAAWYPFGFLVDTNNVAWADFPTTGFNKDKITVSWNYLDISDNSPNGVGVFVFDKTNLSAGTAIGDSFYQPYNPSPGVTNGLDVTPAVSYNTNDATFWLLQTFIDNQNSTGYLAMYSITGAIGSEVLRRLNTYPSAPGWAGSAAVANLAPQLGASVNVNMGDARLSQVVYRNDSLWCAHTIFLPTNSPTRSSVQWWQIRTNGTIVQHGLIDDTNGVYFYGYPSVAVNKFGDALIGYSRFSTNEYPRANYSFHALNDPSSMLESEYLFEAGVSPYWKIPLSDTRNRWGDYSMTWVDPVNDADFWTVQEYAAQYSGTLTNGSGRWGVWWANLQVTVAANDFFTNATTLTGQQGSIAGNNIRATKEPGEPNIGGNAGGASVWYNWTAPSNGVVTIDTIGSTFNTLLGIFTGSTVSALTTVTNDNGSAGMGASRVAFTATKGTVYRIAVDGYNGQMGNITLNWIQPNAPVFTTQPASQVVYQGNNATFTAVALGTPTPTYQWQFNGGNISGATSTSYTISGVQTSNAGDYTAVASNSFASVTSSVAILTVAISQATLAAPIYTNGQFKITVSMVTSLSYIIQASTNLLGTNWITLATNTAPFIYTDRQASNYVQRFYRAVYKP